MASLPETENGWLEDDVSFLLGRLDVWAYFQGPAVSFREGNDP